MKLKELLSQTLNGPVLEGYSCLISVLGHQVLVTGPTEEFVVGLATFIGAENPVASHSLTGQPPWYQNQTRVNDLSEQLKLKSQISQRRSILRP